MENIYIIQINLGESKSHKYCLNLLLKDVKEEQIFIIQGRPIRSTLIYGCGEL